MTNDETAADAWRQALELEFGWALRATSLGFVALAEGSVDGIPGGARGYLALVAVSAGSAPTQLALAHRLSVDKTQMTTLIDDLERDGLVRRAPDPRDRRARLVTITAAGRRRLARAHPRLMDVERRLLDPLEPAEQEAFRSMVSRVAAGVTDGPRPPRVASSEG